LHQEVERRLAIRRFMMLLCLPPRSRSKAFDAVVTRVPLETAAGCPHQAWSVVRTEQAAYALYDLAGIAKTAWPTISWQPADRCFAATPRVQPLGSGSRVRSHAMSVMTDRREFLRQTVTRPDACQDVFVGGRSDNFANLEERMAEVAYFAV
jgi:hypothetical protein